ncbi:MAG: FliA/WhiG family RNA polymerase sigma factor [Planctomycetota bacterium]|nr:FliA/WhiG family RNA polymerase sigma factor [Planctomycetota bacterium]
MNRTQHTVSSVDLTCLPQAEPDPCPSGQPAARAATPRGRRQPVAPATLRTAAPREETQRPGRKGPDRAATDALWERFEAARASGETLQIERLRNELVERYMPLVRGSAERLLRTLPNSVDLEDLVSAGVFGLMDAIRGFDTRRGIKFATYCSSRVRGSILDQLRSEDWVPRLVRRRAGGIDKAEQDFMARFGREPNHVELARELEIDTDRLTRELQNADIRSMHSFSRRWDDEGRSVELSEMVEDPSAEDPMGAARERDMMDEITRSLSDRDRLIIRKYYEEGRTLREIGNLVDLTESRVCQIHSNVMDHLRLRLGTKQQELLAM